MRRISILLLVLFALHVSAAPPQGANGRQEIGGPQASNFTVFDAPGAGTGAAQGTAGLTINTAGVIAGPYTAADYVTHGFVRAADGTFTTFSSPHAGTSANQGTVPFSISSKGVTTGIYIDTNKANHGFVRAATGTITEFDAPGASNAGHRGTVPFSINTAGVIAGAFDTGSYQTTTHWHGFVRAAGGTITTFDAPGAGTGDKQGTQIPVSINTFGVITGTYTDSNYVYHGFIRAADGTMTTFDAPGAGKAPGPKKDLQFQGTIPITINPAGAIAGVYSDPSFVNHGFVRAANGTITSFDVPGAGGSGLIGTVPFSINTAGVIAGLYQDANGVLHGFTRAASGSIASFDAPGAGGTGMQGTGALSVNTAGAIAGTYVDANNVLHGFVLAPLTATTTTLSSSLNPSVYGQPVTFTAVVTSKKGAPPDGETVTFMKGTTTLGTATLSGGSAKFTISTLKVGTNAIKAVYAGDSSFASSTSKAVSQIVGKATTTTTLTSSLNPSNFGQAVTFTATVTPQYSGTVTGNVAFTDGATLLKTVKLSGGVAKYTTSALASGSHTITATYNGSTSFTGSSASLIQTVH